MTCESWSASVSRLRGHSGRRVDGCNSLFQGMWLAAKKLSANHYGKEYTGTMQHAGTIMDVISHSFPHNPGIT